MLSGAHRRRRRGCRPAARWRATSACRAPPSIEAFDRLIAEGLVESRVGSGTFVSDVLESERPQQPPPIGKPRPAPASRACRKAMDWAVDRFGDRPRLPYAPRAFMTALPAFDAFPMAQWARLAAKHWRGSRDGRDGLWRAVRPRAAARGDRRASARQSRHRLRRGADLHRRRRAAGVPPDRHACCSIPATRCGSRTPARSARATACSPAAPSWCRCRSTATDCGSRRGCGARRDFRLAFVTPSHQQPLGHVMSLERRFALLHAAEQAGAWIVEDDYDGEFFFGGAPLPTLKSVDRTGLRDLRRHLQQVAVPGAAARLHAGAAVAGRDVRERARRPSCRACRRACRRWSPSSSRKAISPPMSAACAASTRSATRRCTTAARRELGGLLDVVRSRERPAHDRLSAAAPLRDRGRARGGRARHHGVADRALLDRAGAA